MTCKGICLFCLAVGLFLTHNPRKPFSALADNVTHLPEDSTHSERTSTDVDKSRKPVVLSLAGQTISSCNRANFCLDLCSSRASDLENLITTESTIDLGIRGSGNSTDEKIVEGVQTNSVGLQSSVPRCKKVMFTASDCYCDETCVLYGDCCPDVFENCLNLKNTEEIVSFHSQMTDGVTRLMPITSITRSLTENPDQADMVVDAFALEFGFCETIKEYPAKHVWLINLCPDTVSDGALKVKCENATSSLFPPVTAVIQNKFLTFKNIFCAQCHDITDTNTLKAWSSELNCSSTELLDPAHDLTLAYVTSLVSAGECSISFTEPVGSCVPKYCQPWSEPKDALNTFNITNKNNESCSSLDLLLCKSYYFPENDYRNPHCEICLSPTAREQDDKNSQQNCLPLHVPMPGHTYAGEEVDTGVGGILIILDITGTYSQGTKTSYICGDQEVFDPFTQECRQLLCSYGFEPYRGKCTASHNTYIVQSSSQIFPNAWKEASIQVTLNNLESPQVKCDGVMIANILNGKYLGIEITKITIVTINVGNEHDANVTQTHVINDDVLCEETFANVDTDPLQNIEISVTLTDDVHVNTINTIKSSSRTWASRFIQRNETYEIAITNIITVNESSELCTKGLIPKWKEDFSLEEYRGELYAVFNSSKKVAYFPFKSTGFLMRTASNHDGFSEQIKVCEESDLFSRDNCSIVVYNRNETIQNDFGLLILHSGEIYPQEDFAIQGDQVFVCTDFRFEVKVKDEPFQESLAYLTMSWVFTLLSIIFLLMMLVIYFLFPELRTLPGKLIASLAGTMMLTFLSNLFTLVDLHNDYVCPIVAACSHLVTLAHFGWMAAIGVNMALTFGYRSMSLTKSQNSNKTFTRYCAVVWGLSTAIVATSLILDFTHKDVDTASEKNNSSFIISGNIDERVWLKTPLNSTVSSTHAPIMAQPLTADGTSRSGYPRYGYPFCTWFSGELWTRLAFVLIPYFITYIITVVSFVISLIGIQQSSKSVEKLGTKSSDKTRCLIYFKLATAMGFAWILSILLSIFPDTVVLPCIYMILVLLQGVLLFLAFMVNKRVYSIIRRRSASSKETSSSSATRSSMVRQSTK